MRDRFLAVLYLVAVVTISATQDIRALAVCCALILLAGGRRSPRLARRALLATGFFTGLVSVAWLVAALFKGTVPTEALIRLNLRVFAMTTLTFVAVARLDLRQITAFAPRLQTLVVLILAQIGVYRRLLGDFRMATRSRTFRRPALRESVGKGAAVGATFLRRAEHEAAQLTQGMVSRGFFDD
jgi:hypothetical protein